MVKHNLEQMRAAFAMRERQGLTFEELSRQTEIPISTLSYWSRKLRNERDVAAFEEVRVEDDDHSTGLVVIGPLGHRVVVSQRFDAEHLRRVLAALPC